MSTLMSLFRLSFRNYFGLSAMRVKYLHKREKLWEPALVALGVVAGGLSFGSMFYYLALTMVRGSAMLGQADFVLTQFILLSQIMAFTFGLFAMISILYFSNDLDILVPLPLKAWHILATKLSLVNIVEYAPVVVILAPTLLAYNQVIPLGVLGWFTAFATMLFLPTIPLALAGILAVTVMRGVNRRHRDILMVIASIALLSLILYLQYHFTASMTGQISAEDLAMNRLDFVEFVGASFPPAIWATRAVAQHGTARGMLNLAYLILSSAAAVGAFMAVGQRVFYGGLVGGSERTRRGALYTKQIIARHAVESTALSALLSRELKLFMRMPIWVMNGFITIVLFPLMAFFPTFFGVQGAGMTQVAEMARNHPHGLAMATLVVAAAIAFMTSLNTLASTAISREGKYLWISKTLPVSAKKQLTAKLIFALGAAIPSSIPLVGVYAFLFQPGAAHLATAYILGITAGFTPQVLGLWFDIWRPFLTWTNHQHAVKNNLNAVSPMLFGAALGFVSFLAYRQLIAQGTWTTLLVLLLTHSALAILATVLLLGRAEALYSRLEVKG
ncbi:MAG: hypothetical protein KGZ64_08260 [Thermaerobacter sp.]|nr:hypothetical protein [Thermaerobacter sp.]